MRSHFDWKQQVYKTMGIDLDRPKEKKEDDRKLKRKLKKAERENRRLKKEASLNQIKSPETK